MVWAEMCQRSGLLEVAMWGVWQHFSCSFLDRKEQVAVTLQLTFESMTIIHNNNNDLIRN